MHVSLASPIMIRLRCVWYLVHFVVILLVHIHREFYVFDYVKINVGEPHLPISIAARGKATICPHVMIDKGQASTGDHYFHCVNFTPSVNLILDVKAPSSSEDADDILQSFYKGMCVYECV